MAFYDIILYGLIVYGLYSVIRVWLLVVDIKKSAAEAVVIIENQIKCKMLVFENVEQNGYNVVLCYDIDNNFVAQGATKDQVIELAKQRYPNQNLGTYKIEELQWIKSKSETNSTNG
jgi:hypothetical protein